VIGVALTGACGANQTLTAARHSAYNTDRSVVLREVAAYLRERERGAATVDDAAGTISTEWHEVRPETPGFDEHAGRAFVRTDVVIAGGPPWRLTIRSHGQRFDNAVPSNVADDTSWVVSESDRILSGIHRRLERYAVPVEE
jgi:hypothetical protein